MKRRRSEKEQKKLADDQRLLRWWAAWHEEQREEALAKHPILSELFRMLENLQHVSPVQLVGFTGSIDWSAIDYSTRLTVLHEVNSSFTAFRVKRDLEPISDPLPGEPDSPFRLIKAILFPPPQEGAPRGEARPDQTLNIIAVHRSKTDECDYRTAWWRISRGIIE